MASVAAPSFSQHGGQVAAGLRFDDYAARRELASITRPTATIRGPFGGGINGTLYSSPVDISAGLTVKARAFDGVNWSALTEATFTVAAPAGPSNLRIVEIHYNPPATPGVGDAQNLEFIELFNPSGQAVSLDGVQITEFDNTPYTFPDGDDAGAGGRIVVAKNPTVFQSIYGGSILLAPGGYRIGQPQQWRRADRAGRAGRARFRILVYDDADGWPTAADGQGSSLEIIDPMGDASSPLNWRASYYARRFAGDRRLAAGGHAGRL